MTGTLFRYLAGMFMTRLLAALLGLSGLLELLALLDTATDILQRKLGAAGILRFVWLRLPSILDQAIVLSVLVGALLTLGQLARRNEMVILRAAGLTVYRVGVLLSPCVALVAVAHFLLADHLVPQSQEALAIWWNDTALDRDDDTGKTIWFRVSPDVIAVEAIARNGAELDGVRLYHRGSDGLLTSRISATKALYADGRWTLIAATETVVKEGEVSRQPAADRPWPVTLEPHDVLDLTNPANNLASNTLQRILAGDGAGNRSRNFYRTKLQEGYAAPLASFVMLLIGLTMAYGTGRDRRGDRLLLGGLGLGLAFLLVNGILGAFGEAGTLPPALAAWAALPLFACIAGAILLRREEP